MTDGIEKLRQDSAVLAVFATEMADYLKSDVLFWQTTKGNVPKLTLGGYLMREHRLLALKSLLPETEQTIVDDAVRDFSQALVEQIVRFEVRAHRELDARLRQWSEALKDFGKDAWGSANYSTAVETRAMIAALCDRLRLPPYQLEERVPRQVQLLDSSLRGRWRQGPFVWPVEWERAYPKSEYWWLYGNPS